MTVIRPLWAGHAAAVYAKGVGEDLRLELGRADGVYKHLFVGARLSCRERAVVAGADVDIVENRRELS